MIARPDHQTTGQAAINRWARRLAIASLVVATAGHAAYADSDSACDAYKTTRQVLGWDRRGEGVLLAVRDGESCEDRAYGELWSEIGVRECVDQFGQADRIIDCSYIQPSHTRSGRGGPRPISASIRKKFARKSTVVPKAQYVVRSRYSDSGDEQVMSLEYFVRNHWVQLAFPSSLQGELRGDIMDVTLHVPAGPGNSDRALVVIETRQGGTVVQQAALLPLPSP